MKNISQKAKPICVSILVLIFAITVITVNPLSVQAATASKAGTSKVTLAQGTRYATDLYIIESGKPGPVVMIVGGIHGNETAGYTAATKISQWKIDKGTLLVLPKANKLAVDKKVRYLSSVGDLNRDFPQSSKEGADTILARAIWSAVKKYDVDWLMDMHEGYDYSKNSSTSSVGQSLIYYPDKTKSTVSVIVKTLNNSISTSYKKFSLFQYPVKGSLARAAGQYLGVRSFIFETCDNPSLSIRVNYQLKAGKTLLQQLDMM
ncbi:putative periplasmic protein [hydrocarbon metagenome]|uniref:Putative periplasmic protein n=1 Tax=hydrocarbon metagenome TaxID=938273 RepID=A0A0W8E700_9ZZZZ